jgi:hypothetical protein
MPERRFPPPWTLEENNDACFIVKDATGPGAGLRLFRGKKGNRRKTVCY